MVWLLVSSSELCLLSDTTLSLVLSGGFFFAARRLYLEAQTCCTSSLDVLQIIMNMFNEGKLKQSENIWKYERMCAAKR